MSFVEFVGVPASGKTEKAKQFLKSNIESYPGRKSLNLENTKNKNFFFFGIPLNSDFNKIIFFSYEILLISLQFYFCLRNCSFINKLKSIIFLNSLLCKSGAMSSSKKLYVVDQGLQQFILATLAKKNISLKNAKRFSEIFKNSNWSAHKYIFLFIEEDEMKIRIKNSKKHLSFLKKSKIKNYCGSYICAAKLLFFDNKLKESYEYINS